MTKAKAKKPDNVFLTDGQGYALALMAAQEQAFMQELQQVQQKLQEHGRRVDDFAKELVVRADQPYEGYTWKPDDKYESIIPTKEKS